MFVALWPSASKVATHLASRKHSITDPCESLSEARTCWHSLDACGKPNVAISLPYLEHAMPKESLSDAPMNEKFCFQTAASYGPEPAALATSAPPDAPTMPRSG
eukprot:gnl/MRDRNA2_/MRDRNA2_304338_c0_seq1.p1 gnl/MRDRNA2_/MRDRNA2_304338_c0~~gnl/MRDRNA2_/MRDRNA2_304338_c0_seq1.p1  ORF type:complete len:121 (+),score=13.25 gnl/MRDRNA2_/MRDRNA2_304338_c0_seq1:53-364(+)